MRGTLTINGWFFVGTVRLSKNLISNRYRNRNGWTAEEMFSGPQNKPMGLLVRDASGKTQGLVQDVSQLP